MKSFLHGKKSFPTESLRPPPQLAAAMSGNCKSPNHPGLAQSGNDTSAHVEVVKEGDKVVRLIVTCQCGERIEIECLYPAGR